MTYDMHVHVAELDRHDQTDHFLRKRPNRYVRLFLKRLGLDAQALGEANINAVMHEQIAEWMNESSVDRFVLLAMDGVYDRDGRFDSQSTAWMTDNDFVATMADEHRRMLFGSSIHPYRKDAVAQLGRLVTRGACLVKWIPSAQQIRLDDPLCEPFYEAMADHGLPLLVHTGNEHTSSRTRNEWNDPSLLVHPLRRGVKVIAAHCGAQMYLHERCFFKTFVRMAMDHEHLYGDLSAFGIPTRLKTLRAIQRNSAVLGKVVYGSDFPAIVMVRWFLFSLGWRGMKALLREKNPFEQAYQFMQRLEMPDEVFTRAGSILKTREVRGAI